MKIGLHHFPFRLVPFQPLLFHFAFTLCFAQSLSAKCISAENLPRGALQTTLQAGFDLEPSFQFGTAVDGYLRLTRRFSAGLRIVFLNTLDVGTDLPVVPEIPLDLLLSWDFELPSGRVMIPLTIGAGISLLPAYSNELFIDMFTLETGVKIRLAKKLWLAVVAGSRALMHLNFNYGGSMPHGDFRLLIGPYIRL